MDTKPTALCIEISRLLSPTALMVVILAPLWTINPRPAGAQVVLNCSISPLFCTGLTVQGLSIYATMPDGNGNQLVTASFRVTNINNYPALSSSTTVQWAGTTTVLATPPLLPYATAFFGTTITTSLTDFTITVTTANGNTASYHFVANGPALGRWRPIGPSEIVFNGNPEGVNGVPLGVGRIGTIALDGSTTGTVYAGARASGLWKTVDGGGTWEPLTDALPTTRIDAVAINSANPKNVFIATPAGIFSSADGGHVWRLIYGQNLLGQIGTFIIRGFSLQILGGTTTTTTSASTTGLVLPSSISSILNVVLGYLTTLNGLEVSVTGGFSWYPVLTGGVATSLDQDRANANHMLATIVGQTPGAGSAVYETFSGGLLSSSWHKLQGCPGAPLPALPDGQSAGLWVTQSGTTQWISVKNGAQHDVYSTTGQTCLVNGSPEHGWQHVFSGNPCGRDSTWSFLHADPRNAQILYKGGTELCRSTDGGASFQSVPGPHADQHDFVFHPLYPSLLYEGNDGGLYRSDDGGQTFAFDAVGLSVSEFLDTDVGGASPRIVLGSAQDNGTSATDLTTPVWQVVDVRGDGDRTTAVVDPLNSNTQYSVGQAVDHLTIIQNGLPASLDSTGLPTGCITYVDYPPALFTQFLATGNPSLHLLTTVGSGCGGGLWTGPPWSLLFAPVDGEAFTRLVYDPATGVILAGGDLGSIYAVYFGAKVWQAPQGSVTSIVPDPSTPGNYFVALNTYANTGAGRIFEISPAGVLNFVGQDVTGNLPPALVNTIASNPFEPGVLYAGMQGQGAFRGVRDSTGHWSWSNFSNGMPVQTYVTKLRVDPVTGTIYASTLGRGEFALDTVQNIIY